MTNAKVAGTEPGERRLNGPQTTGRSYHDLSAPEHDVIRETDVVIPMRDGTVLLADVYRPRSPSPFPALLAAAPYPRQMQDLGAPAGVIEAGASDFWVPRGYVHVIANLRGTVGSDGTWTFFDLQEREDLYDLVEWTAEQPWCDGEVGMIGISYYAMAQLEAAVMQPPHLKAVFPYDVSISAWEAANHNGLFSSAFITPWISALGVLSHHGDALYRGGVANAARRVLGLPRVHKRFETAGGAGAVRGLNAISRFSHDPEPWTDLWLAASVEHQTRDVWWDERDITPLLKDIQIPVYLGSEWPNVPLHLGGTLNAWSEMSANPNVRMSILGEHGLPWPWESMHVEALAWFDQWLKHRDTGILQGPRVRYWMPGAEEWRATESWPPDSKHLFLHLGQDGALSTEARAGERSYLTVSPAQRRLPGTSVLPLPDRLEWTTPPLEQPIEMAGDLELQLTATTTASDTGWIALLEDLSTNGTSAPVTQGWLRASLREIDEAASRPGRPVLPLRHPESVPPGERIEYRIPLVSNARRFAVGHRLRLTLMSDDTARDVHVMENFTHTPVGTSSVNTVSAASRLVLPVVA